MKKFFTSLLLLCSFLGAAQAQSVRQTGTMTPGHPAQWVTSGVIGDGGAPAQGSLTGIGVTASGPAICQNSGPISAAYNQVCLGVTQTGGATLSVTNVGGATGGFTLSINGVNQGFVTVSLPTVASSPACFLNTSGTLTSCSSGGIVSGPGSSTANAVARWSGTGGAALLNSLVIIDNSGNVSGAASYNNVAITAPASLATFTLTTAKTFAVTNSLTLAGTDGKTLTANSTLTLAGVDGKTLTVNNSGTLAGGDAFTLAIAAGKTLTANSTLTFGGTDGKTITVSNTGTLAGGDAFVLAIAAAKTFTVSNTMTLVAGADGQTFTFPSTSDTVAVLGVAQTFTAAKTWTLTQAANTSLDGVILADTTAASAANQQFSPRIRLTGQGWKTTATAASQTVDWIIENQPVQGAANPTTNLVHASQVNAGGYTAQGTLTSGGIWNVATGFQIAGAATSGNVLRGNGTNFVSAALAAADLSNGTTGTGLAVLQTSPTLITPTLGVATVTSINKLAITTPATNATLSIADGKTFTVSNTLTFVGVDGNSFTFPSGSDTIVTLGASQTLTSKTLTAPTINGGTAQALTNLGIRSTGAAFDLVIASTEVFTANRTLTVTLNNAARALNISGDITTAAAFTTSGANALTLTTTGATNVTLPTTGTLVNTAVTTLSNLASIGTITTGVWQGTAVAVAFGGTGQTTASAARTSSGLNIEQMSTTGDANVTIASTTRTQATAPGTTFTATRTWTLPAANSINAGQTVVINDISGAINGVNTLTVARAGTDTINGATSTSLATQFQRVIFESDGVSKWSFTSGASGAGSGTVTSISCGNQTISVSGTCITDPGLGLQNCSLTSSVSTNLLTVALKDASGNDPTSTSPCTIGFRSNTATTGTTTVRYVTAATSINTNATGATLGSSNSKAFRFWVVAFDNAGTVVMGLYNATGSQGCRAIDETQVQSSTAISGTATSAQVFYSPNGTTITSKPVRILGFVEYNSTGLTTAGTYASAPNFTQVMGSGVRPPCAPINFAQTSTSTNTTSTSSTYTATNVTTALTLTSAANIVRVDYFGVGQVANGNATSAFVALHRGNAVCTTQVGPITKIDASLAAAVEGPIGAMWHDIGANTTSAAYTACLKNSDNTTSVNFPSPETNTNGGMMLTEIMG